MAQMMQTTKTKAARLRTTRLQKATIPQFRRLALPADGSVARSCRAGCRSEQSVGRRVSESRLDEVCGADSTAGSSPGGLLDLGWQPSIIETSLPLNSITIRFTGRIGSDLCRARAGSAARRSSVRCPRLLQSDTRNMGHKTVGNSLGRRDRSY